MKILRIIFIGLLIGGGFGIAFGIQIANFLGHENLWLPIELGLKYGMSLGISLALFNHWALKENSNANQY